MTRDEHIRKAEEYLREAEKSALSSTQRATAEATIGLLHVALATTKPITVTFPGPAAKPPVTDTDWLRLENR